MCFFEEKENQSATHVRKCNEMRLREMPGAGQEPVREG
jgi:hypothetical protein